MPRSRFGLAVVCALFCAAMIAVPATTDAQEAPSAPASSLAIAGDWCPVGTYMSPTNRCCLNVDACTSTYPALPRPYVVDPPASLSTSLSGAEQSETTPGDPDGSGTFTAYTKPDLSQVCFTIHMSGIKLNAIAGHIHKAPRGSSIVVPSVDLLENVNNTGTVSQCREADPLTIRELRTNPTAFYVQIHNLDYPEGAIRGQLGD